ncbi:phospholipase C/P1 nuclease domain-containing protein [Trichoderma sp. SZMC 28011]
MSSISKVALVTLATLQGANAWGVLGHATVAYVAQHYLNAATASWAQGVLNDTSSSYLASIASWADTYRTTAAGKFSAPFHFIDAEDNPPSSCNVDYDRDCGSTGCSISAMANYTQRVGDGRLSAANTAEALKFLVHFVGDITQPLHDEAYEVGGNDISVTFQGYSDNLHSDWDTYIPEALIGGDSLTDAQTWANTLISEITSGTYKSQAASWIKGDTISDVITTATRWATDANALVCTVVMPNGAAALQKGDLYPTYYNSVIDTVELQIAKGGYRLANWLNMVYTSNIAKREEGSVEGRDTSPLPDLMGRDLLPAARPATRAQLARAAMGGSCCGTAHDHEHKH